MKVALLNCTPDPIATISIAAGTCYGKPDASESRVEHCVNAGHMSVLEHASATFQVGGISRSCSHQLVRHRLASYSQKSQRYCKLDRTSDDWYVLPKDLWTSDISGNSETREMYEEYMSVCRRFYNLLLDKGLKPEDARLVLPEACKTDIVVTMNCRELFLFFDLRQSKRAQWEIRDLANKMEEVLANDGGPEWKAILSMRRRES